MSTRHLDGHILTPDGWLTGRLTFGDAVTDLAPRAAAPGDRWVVPGFVLASKGYPVFIKPRPQSLFAVRVGKYPNKREADEVAARLEQQEQFNKPWVTR
jgi:hypothetical protein